MLALVLGAGAAMGGGVLAARVMDACEIGVNAVANSFGLMLVVPMMILVYGVAFAAVFQLAFRAAVRGAAPFTAGVLAFLAGLLSLALITWGWLAWGVTGYQVPATCQGDLTWWPSWLPL